MKNNRSKTLNRFQNERSDWLAIEILLVGIIPSAINLHSIVFVLTLSSFLNQKV